MTRINRGVLSVLCAAAMSVAGAGSALGQCATYSIQPISPAPTFVSGVDDTGNHADDGVTTVIPPFFISLYGTDYAQITVSSNGNIQFATAATAYTNNCLPSATFPGPTIFLMWDDLYTAGTAAGQGIFTTTTGTAPNRQFIVEWRAHNCCTTTSVVHNFEAIFYEGSNFFDVLYQTVDAGGTDSTVGIQASASGPATQYSCNTVASAVPSAGLALRFMCQAVEPSGACCTSGACAAGIVQSQCLSPSTFILNGACEPNPCPQPGACCSTTGVCTSVLGTSCAAPSVFQGSGSVCSPDPCAALLGACCSTAGACTSVTSTGCTGTSVFQGPGTVCGVVVCPGPGSCCTPGGCCTSTLQAACGSPNVWTNAGVCTPNPCAPPANDACSGALGMTLGTAVTGSNCSATDDAGIACATTSPTYARKTVWYHFNPATSGYYDLSACGTSFDSTLGIYTDCTFATEVASNDDSGTQTTLCPLNLTTVVACTTGSTLASHIPRVWLNAGTDYKIAIGTWSTGATPAGGAYTLVINTTVAGACCDATTNLCSIRPDAASCTGTYRGDGTACSPNPCGPTNPVGAGSFGPNPVPELSTANLFVNVTLGDNPPSSGVTVTVDATPIGGGAAVVLHNDGVAPDVSAADLIYSGSVVTNAAAGTYPVTFTVADAQSRTSTGTINVVIAAVNGACCGGTSCSISTGFNCVSGGGTFLGAGTTCGGPWYNRVTNANTFTSIAATGTQLATVSACDDCVETVTLPFFFSYLGTSYSDVTVSSNGYLEFGGTISSLANVAIPNTGTPNNIIAALWDDLNPNSGGDIYTLLQGVTPNQTFTISWEGVPQFGGTDSNNFQVVLHENGDIEVLYGTITAQTPAGDYTVGFENSDGTAGLNIDAGTLGTGNTAFTLASTNIANPCDVSTGACCVAGACSVTTQAACTGTWTSGGACTPNPCPQPNGACCCGSSCTLTSAAACTGPNRTFAGAGTACNVTNNFTTPCCKGDYNKTGSQPSVQDIFDFLSGYFNNDACADTNGTSTITVQDIFDFLSAYFGGC